MGQNLSDNNQDVMGGVLPSKLEQATYEKALYANRVMDVPNNLRMKLDYDARTDGQPLYQGFAPTGLADDANGWLLYEFTYDASGFTTERNIAWGNWDGRAGYTYA